jgi:hypothetical protein
MERGKAMIKRFYAAFAMAAFLLTVPAEAEQAYMGQISGDFKGWEGETIYELLDGHIIQQSEYHYHYHYAFAPRVIIYQSSGGYKIHVLGDNDQDVGVRILK